uniref:Uncharacterized protein n=1 Tax=Bracon brevicornis TaxID=1563983 RepID=A0A6V7KIR6_9HYME
MPSAEDTTYLYEVMPETTQDYFSSDMDLLVSQIKENLRLSTLKARSSAAHRRRPSPYLVPSRSEMRRIDEVCRLQKEKNKDDPYEKLMDLLKQGRLISEAVKKLRRRNFDDLSDSEDDEDEDIDALHRGYRRKTYYYDSEDEPLPSVYDPDI